MKSIAVCPGGLALKKAPKMFSFFTQYQGSRLSVCGIIRSFDLRWAAVHEAGIHTSNLS